MKPHESIRRAPARCRDFALLVIAVGVAALVCDSWPNPRHGARINLHGAFGALLWIMAVVQFQQHARLLRKADFGRLYAQPSRTVYLVLYIVFGAQQLIRAAALLWNRAILGASHPAILSPPENLRDLLAYGIVALLTIRVLAALHSAAVRRARLNLTLPDLQHHK